MKVVSKFSVSIFYTFREISRLRALRSGRASSSFWMIQLDLNSLSKFISIFFKGFRVVLMPARRPIYAWLLIGTSKASLTRNYSQKLSCPPVFMKIWISKICSNFINNKKTRQRSIKWLANLPNTASTTPKYLPPI